MQSEIKYFHSPDIENLEDFCPEYPNEFCFLLQVMVGPKNVDGEESFDIVVCTPGWLLNSGDDIIIGRHHLIVSQYDWTKIKNTIEQYIAGCTGDDWNECALKISRLGKWEFEDYQEPSLL